MPPPRFYRSENRGVIKLSTTRRSRSSFRHRKEWGELGVIDANMRRIDADIDWIISEAYRKVNALKKERATWARRLDRWPNGHRIRK